MKGQFDDPPAWRRGGGALAGRIRGAGGGRLCPPARTFPRALRQSRHPGRRFPYRGSHGRHGRRDRIRPARPVPGCWSAVSVGQRAGTIAQHDLALPAARSSTTGPSTRTAWAPSSPTCWCTRSATISASRTTTSKRSRRRWIDRFRSNALRDTHSAPDRKQTTSHGKIHHPGRRRRADEDDQCRHRHGHPQAIPEDHQAHWARQGPVFRDALQGRRQREPGFRAQQAGLSQGRRSWSPATISAAARAASTRPGR